VNSTKNNYYFSAEGFLKVPDGTGIRDFDSATFYSLSFRIWSAITCEDEILNQAPNDSYR